MYVILRVWRRGTLDIRSRAGTHVRGDLELLTVLGVRPRPLNEAGSFVGLPQGRYSLKKPRR